MFAKIELIPRFPIKAADAEETIWDFFVALERNGQILPCYTLVKGEVYTMYATLPKSDSFDEKHDGFYVAQKRKRFDEAFCYTVTPLGEDVESTAYCTCKTRHAIEMQTYYRDKDSVFTCLDCDKPIALYELPYPNGDKDHTATLWWQENYMAMDRLWMNCLCDRYTGNQRVKHDSALNKQGIQIARSLSEQLGYPVYYRLECDYGKSIKAEKVDGLQIHVCPQCLVRMKRTRFAESYEIDLCESCMLSYIAH